MTSSFDDLLNDELDDIQKARLDSEVEDPHHSLVDNEDKWILMHRETHFSGSFTWMLNYYLDRGLGCDPEINEPRIQELAVLEEKLGENLAPFFLNGADAERVLKCKKAYQDLRDLCERGEEGSVGRLLAELILSEKEHPVEEINQLTALGNQASDLLLTSLQSSTFHDPLAPGYGHAPRYFIQCLGILKEPKAIQTLFSLLKDPESSEFEEEVYDALKQIGEPAKEFLIQAMRTPPFTQENAHAALCLVGFQDEHAASAALDLLEQEESLLKKADLSLIPYLLMVCEFLPKEKHAQFVALKERIPSDLDEDYQLILRSWGM